MARPNGGEDPGAVSSFSGAKEKDITLIIAEKTKALLEEAGYKLLSAEKSKVPSNYVTLDNEDDIKFMGLLIERLEEDDDVMEVYHNCENCD